MRDRLISDERGFTLPELLVSASVGVIVLMAALTLLDMSLKTQSDASARVDSVQRGRSAMNEIGRAIRAQTCIGNGQPAITSATASSLALTTSIAADLTQTQAYQPLQLRTIAYDSVNRRITISTIDGSGAPPSTTFTGGSTTRVVAENVRLEGSTPFLTYYGLQGTGQATLQLNPGAGSLTLSQRHQVVRVDVNFLIRSRDAAAASQFTRYTNRYWVRTADPADISAGAGCT